MTVQALEGIRKTPFSVACALLGICVLLPAASARQASSGGTVQQQPATAKPAGTTPPSKASSSSTSAGKTKSASAAHATSAGHRPSRKRAARVRGQKKIDPERARTIQEALIREHYLTGEPPGMWNQASEDAMRRYQGDHGWQTKEVPDSRALISLGLGPSKDHLLNPESAMTSGPEKPPAASAATVQQNSTAPAPAPTSTPAPSSGDPSKPQ